MDIEKQFNMPTSDVIVITQTSEAEIKGLGQAGGQMTMQDGTLARFYDLSSFKKDDKVALQIAGLTPPKSEKDLWVLMCVVFGVIGVLVVTRLCTVKNKSDLEAESE